MCLNLNDYQFKVSRYSYGSTYMNSMAITNQKCTIHKNQKERNSSTLQKEIIKPQKEKQKEEMNKGEL